jgi:hypothetical protein
MVPVQVAVSAMTLSAVPPRMVPTDTTLGWIGLTTRASASGSAAMIVASVGDRIHGQCG